MLKKQDLGRLLDYTEWANHRVVRAAATLEVDAFRRDLGASHGGVRGTLAHMLSAEWIWVERFKGNSPPRLIDEGEFPDVLALKGRWALAMEDSWARASWLADWALVLRDDEPVPDYEAAIEAVTAADLARVVNTYFTPAQSYVGEHRPVVTIASGTAVVGATVGLGIAAWIGRKVWRRGTRRKSDGSAVA